MGGDKEIYIKTQATSILDVSSREITTRIALFFWWIACIGKLSPSRPPHNVKIHGTRGNHAAAEIVQCKDSVDDWPSRWMIDHETTPNKSMLDIQQATSKSPAKLAVTIQPTWKTFETIEDSISRVQEYSLIQGPTSMVLLIPGFRYISPTPTTPVVSQPRANVSKGRPTASEIQTMNGCSGEMFTHFLGIYSSEYRLSSQILVTGNGC